MEEGDAAGVSLHVSHADLCQRVARLCVDVILDEGLVFGHRRVAAWAGSDVDFSICLMGSSGVETKIEIRS